METNQGTLQATSLPLSRDQVTIQQQPIQARVQRTGRLPKIKLSATSVRPGRVVASHTNSIVGKPLELHFMMPTNRNVGSADEAATVQDIANRLNNVEGIGSVTSILLKDSVWQVTLTLAQLDVQVPDQDAYLSNIFTTLMPTINSLNYLKTGFSAGKPAKWKYMVGAFVVDEGGYD